MTEQEIQNIIQKGEGLTLEFKKATNKLPKNLFETVCAFLNREGGSIILGVDDNKSIVGVDVDKATTLCEDFASLSNNPNKIDPVFLLQPKVVGFQGKKLIHVFVPSSSNVHKTAGTIFDRSADGDFVIKTDSQISKLYIQKGSFFTENTIYPFLEEQHFVDGIVEKALQIIRNNRPGHPWLNLSRADFYRSTGLYRTDFKTGEQGFTMAALLLFGKEETIQSALPHYKIDAVLRRENIDRYDDRENIRCNLIEAYEILLNFVNKHLPDKFYMQGDQRVSLREKIFREIIANLLMHREYSNANPATFIIYKDRVEVKNANRPHLMGNLVPGNFEPYSKNPNLAKLFVQMARAEDLGTGINNVYTYLKPYAGTVPVFSEEQLFKVVVPLRLEIPKGNENLTENFTENLTENFTENKRLGHILQLISKSNKISTNKLAEKLGVSRQTIATDISLLKEKRKLKRIGPAKGGHWQVL